MVYNRKCTKCQVNECEEGGAYCEGCDAETRAWSCFRTIIADVSIKRDKNQNITPNLINGVASYWIKWFTPLGSSTDTSWYKIYRTKIKSLIDGYERREKEPSGKTYI